MANNNWLYAANTKLYDVFKAFQHETCWPMNTTIAAGDTVYLYLSAPHKQIGYRCTVTKINIDPAQAIKIAAPFMKQQPDKSAGLDKRFMMLKPVKAYPIKEDSPLSLGRLKENGLAGMLMGPRKLNNAPDLLAYIKHHGG